MSDFLSALGTQLFDMIVTFLTHCNYKSCVKAVVKSFDSVEFFQINFFSVNI